MASRGEPALVVWVDATRSDDAFTGHEDIGIIRRTVGWLLRDDKDGVVVAMSKDGDSFERGFTIPRAYIKRVRRLK